MNNGHKVLVVEDESIIALSIQEKLMSQGYEVPAIASTGEMAVELFNKYQPHVILMDVVLAGLMDGIEASREIRKNSNVPIVFCTAYSDEQTMERVMAVSLSDFILKPISESELDTKLQHVLSKK